MANLIEQQNQLKGLSDEQLQGEGSSPSGSVPPFLVMTEINRRKTMRDAYTAQQARRKPSTTVAQDLLSAPLGMGLSQAAGGMGAPAGGGGIGIAAALDPGASDIPAFAEGGLVGGDIMDRILKRRTAALEGVDREREDMLPRSLMAAGAAMMSKGSSNFMKNVGAGFTGGIDSWQNQAEVLDSREGKALDGLMGLDAADRADRLAALDEQFRRDQEARLTTQFNSELGAPTADIKNHEYFQGLDLEGQAEYLRVNGSSNSGDSTSRRYAMGAYADILVRNKKAVASQYELDLQVAKTPEERAALQRKIDAEAKTMTDSEFSLAYPDYVTLMPELTAGAPGGTATPETGVFDYTSYF